MASEEFKSLSVTQQRLLVGKAIKVYDAGYSINEIAEKFNISIGLMEEVIEMIEQARKYKEDYKNHLEEEFEKAKVIPKSNK